MDTHTQTSDQLADARRPTRFIARQPIFDRKELVFGYELLFRSGLENFYNAQDGDAAACDVTDNFLSADAKVLTAGRRAFINCTRRFLVNEYATLLPKDQAVVEILETIEPDADVLAACRALKEQGYMLALDDFVYAEKFRPFVELADIIKVDFRLSGPSERKKAVSMFAPLGIQLLAEKVETRQEFEEARSGGYSYFQGYFFCKPQIIPALHIPAFKIHYLQILQVINEPELNRNEIVALLEREVSLCYKLLKFVNSPLFNFRREISSTRHALALLGDREVRKWASVAAVLGIAGDKPNELVLTSLTRGHCCELLAAKQGPSMNAASMFLLGVLSLMDAILGRPLAEIASEIALPEAVRAALMGETNRCREILDLVTSFAEGKWSEVAALTVKVRLEESEISDAYMRAVEWAQKVFEV